MNVSLPFSGMLSAQRNSSSYKMQHIFFSEIQCSEVMCNAVMCSAVQCSTVQCSTVQYSSSVMFRGHKAAPLSWLHRYHPGCNFSLYGTVIHCTALHCTALNYAALYCTVLYYTVL